MYRVNLILLFVVFCTLYSLVQSTCNFDRIQLPLDSLAHVSLRYSRVHVRDLDDRCRSNAWKPIRIYTYFGSLSALSDHDKFRLHTVVESAVQRMKRLLSVKPVIGPLLLRRNKACGAVHTTGVNQGKCASIRPGYQREFCSNKVDNFEIPDQHLMGVDVYDGNGSSPLAASIASALGIGETDYILYVNAAHTDYCLAENVIAYASYCQLDQNDRPIAGLVNFCPSHLKTAQFSHFKAILAVIHELFHAFGFSSELFMKFKECSARGHCFQWKKVVVEEATQFRVVLPSVVSRMQRHFNCSQDDLGAPLEPIRGNSASSHWDPLVLHYSIMSPHLSEPHLMSVDPITLALFDDMGWYRVNYSDVDSYQWAAGAGCDFVQSPQCNDEGSCPSYLCDLRKNADSSGCDYFQSSVSSCSAVAEAYHDVGIYKPMQQGNCQSSITYNGEEKQGCFLSIINGSKEGQCMQYQCSGDELKVLVNHDWWPCPHKSEIFIQESNQNISCPTSSILCNIQHRFGSHQYFDFVGGVAIWIQLKSPIPSSVRAVNGSEEDVRSDAVAELSRTADVPISWVNRTILLAQEYYLLGLLLVPPVDSDVTKQELDVVYHKIQKLTNNGGLNFTYVRHTQTLQPVTEKPWPFRNLRGVYILLLMSGIVLVVVVVSAIGATLIQLAVGRPMVTRSRSPRRQSHAVVP